MIKIFPATLLSIIILQSVLFHNQLMSTKKQISTMYQFFTVNEEIPEKVSDKTDVDSCFYHNILGISQSHYRIIRVDKRSYETSFALEVIHLCDSKLQPWYSLKEDASISKKHWASTWLFWLFS